MRILNYFYTDSVRLKADNMETVIIKESRMRNAGMLLLMLGAATLCMWGVFTPEAVFQPHKRSMTILLSAVALPFLVAGIGILVCRMARPRPVLVLTAEGFEFSYGLQGRRFVPWCEVCGVSLVKVHSVKILCVALHNRKKYIASLPKVYRWIARINRSLGYSSLIQIDAGRAKGYKTEEVVAMMRLYRNNATKTNNTEEGLVGNRTGKRRP